MPILRPTKAILCIDTPERALTYMFVQDLLTDVGAPFLLRVQLLTGASVVVLILLTLMFLLSTSIFGDRYNIEIIPLGVLVECLVIFVVVLYYIFRLITTAGKLNNQMEQNGTTMLDLQKQVLLWSEEHGGRAHQSLAAHVSVFALEDTRLMMMEQYKSRPITFLGLKVGPTMFTALGTLVATVGSSLFSHITRKNE